jgi:hypothetical protein
MQQRALSQNGAGGSDCGVSAAGMAHRQNIRAEEHFCSKACFIAASYEVDDAKQIEKVETRLRDKDRAGL